MRPFRPVLILTCFVFSFVEVSGQCTLVQEISSECGSLSVETNFASEKQDFCVGEIVEIRLDVAPLSTLREFDYMLIDWCDGSPIDTLDFEEYGIHEYLQPPEENCLDENKSSFIYSIQMNAYHHCDDGVVSIGTSPQPVQIKYDPIPNFSYQQIDCDNYTVEFENASCFATTFNWNFDDNGITSSDNNASHNFSGPGIYNVCLSAKNLDCDAVDLCREVRVVDFPNASITYDLEDKEICIGEIVELANSSNTWADYIQWEINPLDTPDAFIFTDTLMTLYSDYIELQFFQTGIYDIKLTASNACKEDSQEIPIEVLDNPIIMLEPIDDQCSQSYILNPVLNTEENLDSISWTFTGGSPNNAIGLNPGSIEFQASNELNEVSVTVMTACGNTTINEKFYVVDPNNKINFSDLEICKSDEPFNIDSLIRDGNWSGDCLNNNDIFNPADCNENQVTLTFTNSIGTCEIESELNVKIRDGQVIEVPANQKVCSKLSTYKINFSPSGGIWLGEELIDSLTGIINPAELGVGNFIFTYAFNDATGCSSQTETEVEIYEVKAAIQNFNQTYCLINENIQLEATPEGGEWFGLNNQNGILNPSEIGIDTLQIIYQYSDASGCSDADTVQIEIIEAPVIQNIPNLVFCCNDQAYDIQTENPISPLGGTFLGDGISPNGLFSPSIICDGEAEIVYQFSTGDANCTVSDTFVVKVHKNPDLPEVSDDVICFNETPINLSEQYPNIDLWQGESITDSLLGTFQPIAAGDYLINYSINSLPNNCKTTNEQTITVEGIPAFDSNFDDIICQDEAIEFGLNSMDNLNCLWEFGNGNTSTDCDIETSFAIPGTYNISLTVATPSGCNDAKSSSLNVIAAPTGSFQIINDNTDYDCAPVLLNYNFTAAGDSLNYFWDFGDGETSIVSEPEHTYQDGVETDTTFYLSLSVWNDCDSISFIDSIKVAPLPKVSFGPNVDDICSGTPIAFNNNSTGNPRFLNWDFGNGDTSTVFSPDSITFYTDDKDTIYTVMLTIENYCGTDTDSWDILVQPKTVIAFPFADTLRGCAPLQVNFQDFSTDGDVIHWEFGDGNSSNEENPSNIFVDPGKYTVMLSAHNFCAHDTAEIEIEVIELPKIDQIMINNENPCSDLALDFSYLTNDELSNVIWYFGNGDSSTLTNPAYVYDTAGIYNLQLEYTSAFTACANTLDTLLEIIESLPVIDAIPDTLRGCEPFELRIAQNIMGDHTFYWDLGNGNTNNQDTLIHTLDTAGMYTVWLYGRNDCGTDSAKYAIEVFPKPSIEDLQFTNTTNCLNDIFHFEFNTNEIISSTSWNFGDGNESTERSPTHQYQTAGLYTVQLTVESPEFDCDLTKELVVEVFPKPEYTLDTLRNQCANTPIEFKITGESGTYFLWDFGDGQTSVEQNPSYVYAANQDTTYFVQVVITNNAGCLDTLQSNIKIYSLPKAIATVVDYNICDLNQAIQFEANSDNAVSYFWDFANGEISTISNPTTEFNNAGDYNITLIAENTFACKDTAMLTIELFEPPTASFTEVDREGCLPYEVTLTNLSENISNISWQIGDDLFEGEQVLNYQFNDLGQYDIEVIVEFDERCYDTLRYQNYFTIYPKPDASFTFDSSSVDLGAEIQFYNTTTGVSLFDWSFGDKETSTLENPIHTYYFNGNYEVVLETTNEFGCADTTSTIIDLNRAYVLNVPNALKPSDPNNEVKVFLPKGIGLVEYELRVYSKWGNLIWKTDELLNGKPYQGWDGTDLQGRAVEQGSYLWEIDATHDPNLIWPGKQHQKLNRKRSYGTVTLLR